MADWSVLERRFDYEKKYEKTVWETLLANGRRHQFRTTTAPPGCTWFSPLFPTMNFPSRLSDPLDYDTVPWYHISVNSKQRKTLEAVFTDPVKAGIAWADIESLLLSIGALMKEGAGSRVGFSLNGVDLVVHRPHPRKETDKGAVKSVRKFLTNAGVTP